MKRVAILASGSGSNAENITNFFRNSKNVRISLFATENPKAFVIDRAKKLGIDCVKFTMDDFKSGAFLHILNRYNIDFIVLAGFLKLVPEYLINEYNNRIVNVHPALLPKYGGKGMYGNKVHEAVIAHKEVESGITIHYVNNNYDEGGVIFQAKCTVDKNDTPDSLAQKIHALEYEWYPKVLESLLG